ncbi:unnamed protein product [Urochloa humidicola]
MSPLKRRRRASMAAPPPEEEATMTTRAALPPDLVLEIAARSDAATLIRCVACCKLFRRDILNPFFIRRVCHRPGASVPPRLLAFLQSYCYHFTPSGSLLPLPPFTLAHPATPAAAHLSYKHIPPFVSRAAGDLLALYDPVTSRGGLVVFCRRSHTGVSQESGICVYDPMTGGRVYLLDPPEMANFSSDDGFSTYALLTAAADGIGDSSSFLLIAVDFTGLMYPVKSIRVRTFSFSFGAGGGGGEWSPVISAASDRRLHSYWLHPECNAVVLGGGVVHWVMHRKCYSAPGCSCTPNCTTTAARWARRHRRPHPCRCSAN